MRQWIENYNKLPEQVKRRLVIRNCEKSYSIIDCLNISKIINIPVVLDNHHFECYNKYAKHESELNTNQLVNQIIPEVLKTWINRKIKPKFHLSEQGDGRIGKHSDYINQIPTYYLEIPSKYQIDIDVMIETKKKELAINELHKKI